LIADVDRFYPQTAWIKYHAEDRATVYCIKSWKASLD